MATEGHLSTLCNILWGAKIQLNSGLADMFALSIIGSMFNGGGFGTTPMPKLEEKDFDVEEENKAE